MKKFINDPENLTSELLEGLALANKDIIHLEDGNLVVNNKLKDADRVMHHRHYVLLMCTRSQFGNNSTISFVNCLAGYNIR